jgi:uncharacterized membrane protein YagU involved in acid resistance
MNKSILGGVIGTAVMTVVMFVAPMMGMPKMSPPDMLAGMMKLPILVGWIIHFMIGIIFALAYTYLFAPKVKIGNIYLKGAAFGLSVFIFAQIALAVLDAMFPMAPMEGSMVLMMIGSIMGHVIDVSQRVDHHDSVDLAK